MYQIGELIVYGGEGVCRVEAVGPLDMRGAKKDVAYYTLVPMYRGGKIFAPVDGPVFTRPVMTREEAEDFVAHIPEVPVEVYENSNPRLLTEHYQTYLKSYNCTDLVCLIRAVYAKEQTVAEKGRHLGQVDERSMKRAKEMLHGELAVALDIPVDEVEDYITKTLESAGAL